MKQGDTIKFRFAGCDESGTIKDIKKDGRKVISYIVWDGQYTYTVKKEDVI